MTAKCQINKILSNGWYRPNTKGQRLLRAVHADVILLQSVTHHQLQNMVQWLEENTVHFLMNVFSVQWTNSPSDLYSNMKVHSEWTDTLLATIFASSIFCGFLVFFCLFLILFRSSKFLQNHRIKIHSKKYRFLFQIFLCKFMNSRGSKFVF